MKTRLISGLGWPAWIALGALTGCSFDVIPVHYSRVKSAQEASRPLKRGPAAPGAFKHSLGFTAAEGLNFDPSQVEVLNGVVRLKVRSGAPKYAIGKVTVELSGGIPYAALDSFSETLGSEQQGGVRYQLSPNSSSWYYHDGKTWVVGGPSSSQANSASEVNSHIGEFHSVAGPGNLYLKIFLVSQTGNEPVSLKGLTVAGIAPKTDGWD